MPAPHEPGSQLLLRDQEELDRVALLLRRARPLLAVIACAETLRPAAIRHLTESSGGKPLAEPELVDDPYVLLDRLTEISGLTAADVRSIAIDVAQVDLLR